MQRVTVDTITLATHEWPGRGPAVVGIHGLTSNHTVWYPIADALAVNPNLSSVQEAADRLKALLIRRRKDTI